MQGSSDVHDLGMIESGVPSLFEFAITIEITRGTRRKLTRAETTRFGQAKVAARFVIDQFLGLERLPDGSKQESRAGLAATLAGADHQVRFGFEEFWFQVSPTIKTVTSEISTIAP